MKTFRYVAALSLLMLALAAEGCSAGRTQVVGTPPSDDGNTVAATSADNASEDDPNRTVTSNDPTLIPTPSFEGEVVEAEAVVESIHISILESFPVQVMVVARGNLPDGCTVISRAEQSDTGSNIIIVRLYTSRPAEAMCTESLVPYEENIALDVFGLPAGEYTVDVNGLTATFTLDVDNSPPDMGVNARPRGGSGDVTQTPSAPSAQCRAPGLPDEGVAEQMADARKTLISFFRLLHNQEYEEAAHLYGGDYEVLSGSNPPIDPDNHGALWQNACTINGYICFCIKRVVAQEQLSPTDFHFAVEFSDPDGATFVRGPCCGADATEMPPESVFDFTVREVEEGDFKVLDMPVYVP